MMLNSDMWNDTVQIQSRRVPSNCKKSGGDVRWDFEL